MLPYILLTLIVGFATLFDKSKYQNTIFMFLSLVMLIFSGFRVGGTGIGDYDAYLRLYSMIDSFDAVINSTIHAEIGFRFLSYLGNYLGLPGQFIIFSMAFLSLFIVLRVIYKLSPYPLLSLLILLPFFFVFNMQTSRTAVAAAFGILFLHRYINKEYLTSALYLILAICFHYSALILLLVFLVHLSLRTLIFFIVFVFIIGQLLNPIVVAINIFNFIGLSRISDFLLIYLNSPDYGYPMKIYDPRVMLVIGVGYLIHRARNSLFYDIKYYKVYLIGIIVLLAFITNTAIALRSSYYFLIISVLIIPFLSERYNLVSSVNHGIKRVLSSVFLLVYMLYSLALIVGFEPYNFIV